MENRDTPFCRTCLRTCFKMKSIEDVTCMSLLQRILSEPAISDISSKSWICFKCEWTLRKFEKFIEQCRRASALLQQSLFDSRNPYYIYDIVETTELSYSNIVSIRTDGANDAEQKVYTTFSHSSKENDLKEPLLPCEFVDVMHSIGSNNDCHDDPSSTSSPKKNRSNIKLRLKKKTSTVGGGRSMIDKKRKLRRRLVKLSPHEQIVEHERRRTCKEYLQSEYKCEMCALPFKQESKWTRHSEEHAESRGSHVCAICKLRFAKADSLAKHARKAHLFKLSCDDCSVFFYSTDSFVNHMKWHDGEVHRCDLCEKTFARRRSYMKHATTWHSESHFQCDLCQKTWPSKESLKNHILRHSSPSFSCETCSKQFYREKDLSVHAKIHSMPHNIYYCAECDLSFKTNRIYLGHMRYSKKHIDTSRLRYDCDACDKKFVTELQLKAHVDCAHLKVRNFACQMCPESYVSRGALQRHQHAVHFNKTYRRIIPCSICGKTMLNDSLRNHMMLHTGEKPFECNDCPVKCSQKSALRSHIQFVHLRSTRDSPTKKRKIENR